MATLAVFGATGGTGRAVVAEARRRGWRSRALCRGAARLEGVDVVAGTLEAAGAIDLVLEGADAALLLYGPRPPFADLFCAAATRLIVDRMRARGMRRLVCQTGAMIGDYPANRTRPFALLARFAARRWPEAMADRARQEQIVSASGLDWTLVKPPRLVDGPSRGGARCGPGLRAGLLSRVCRTDLAALLLDEVDRPCHLGEAVFVL